MTRIQQILLKGSFAAAGLILLLWGAVTLGPEPHKESQPAAVATPSTSMATITFPDSTQITAEIAETFAQKRQGLSGRRELPEGRGMLFVYEAPGRYSFWMPDMHFPIDIIWLDSGYRIVDITHSLAPESYPDTVSPMAPAQYVLEVNAGVAAAHGVTPGQTLQVGGI